MLNKKLNAEVHQVMQSALARTRSYFESEFGISETVVETGAGDVNSLTLLDMTAIIGMGGQINLLIAFSFQSSLIDALYQRMTSDLDVQPDKIEMYREAAAGDVVNTVLGHCTIDLQKLDQQGISMTPPVILDQVKTIQRMKNSMFHTQSLSTALGRMNISLVGPRELFDTDLEYAK
jgi:CheY-specific phosphatase CheX